MSTAAVHRVDRLDASKRKVRDLFELSVAYTLILLTIWTIGRTQRVLLFAATGWIVVTTALLHSEDWDFGLRRWQLRRSWWIVAVAAVLAVGALGIADQVGTLHLPAGFALRPWRVLGYVTWSFVQQFILQDYFLLRLRRHIRSTSVGIAAVATLFSLAHLPNILLTAGTLIWGYLACTLFLRYRNLYSLGLAHAIFGLCIAVTVPDAVHHQMRVGAGYLNYRGHVSGPLVKPQ